MGSMELRRRRGRLVWSQMAADEVGGVGGDSPSGAKTLFLGGELLYGLKPVPSKLKFFPSTLKFVPSGRANHYERQDRDPSGQG